MNGPKTAEQERRERAEQDKALLQAQLKIKIREAEERRKAQQSQPKTQQGPK